MRSISKEFKKYTIHAVRIAKVDGKIVNQPLKAVETYDTVTENNAVKIVKEKMGFDRKEIILVENIVETVEKYTMTGEKFLEHATKIKEVFETIKNKIPSTYNCWDFYVTLNMIKSDNYCMLKDWFPNEEDLDNKFIDMAINFLNDIDYENNKCKIWTYFNG